MGNNNFVFVYCVVLVVLFRQGFSASETTYKAVVVEYAPIDNFTLSIDDRTQANVRRYRDLIYASGETDLDVVVFPEWTITEGVLGTRANLIAISVVVPEKSEEAIPCNNTTYPVFFSELSCFADSLSSYLVVNLLEKEECTSNCASDGWNLYNTNVVFDRTGKVIQRYRKFNTFGEAQMNITDEPELATFETDFGVTFGTFICFDILFEKPALQLVREGVKHIIFPSMWFGELPFLTALQAQTMFAIENDVVLLAAGANSASRGSGGSGIYQGRLGAITEDVITNDTSKVIVANVLKTWDSNTVISTDDNIIDELALDMDNFYLKLDDLTIYKAHRMVSNEFSGSFEDGEVTCQVSWKINYRNVSEDHYDYVFLYFSGVRTFSHVRDGGVDACSLVFCQRLSEDDESLANCAVRYPSYDDIEWTYTIEELSISANFTVSDSSIQFPNTLLSSMRPMDRSDYEWTSRSFDDGKVVERTLTLLTPQDRLMTFGIFGRAFNRDSSANSIFIANFVLALFTLSVVLLL